MTKIRHHFAAVFTTASCAALAGCVTEADMVKPPAFTQAHAAEYAARPKSGTATITGEVWSVTQGGDVKVGAGCIVTLKPVTTYAGEYAAYSIKFDHQLAMPGIAWSLPKKVAEAKEAKDAYRYAECNRQGAFRFASVPAGTYVLECIHSWGIGDGTTTGGMIAKMAVVKEGETVEVQMN